MLTFLAAAGMAAGGSAIAASSVLMANGDRGKGRGGGGYGNMRSHAQRVDARTGSPPAKRPRAFGAASEAMARHRAKVEQLERKLADLKRERGDVTGASTLSLAPHPLIIRELPETNDHIPFSHVWHASAAANQPNQGHHSDFAAADRIPSYTLQPNLLQRRSQ